MSRPKQLLVLVVLLAAGGCAALGTERAPERNAQLRLERGLSALNAGYYTEALDDLAWVYSHCPGREAGVHALTALAALELDPRNRLARPALGTDLLGRLTQHPGTPRWNRPLVETTFLTALALGAPHPAPVDTAAADTAVADTAAGLTVPGDTVAGDDVELAGEPLADVEAAERAAAERAAAGEDPHRAALQEPAPDVEPVYGCGPAVDAEGWVAPVLPTLPGPTMVALLRDAELERDSLAVRVDTLTKQLTAVREQLTATREELERIRKTLKP